MKTKKSDPRLFKFPLRLARGEGSVTLLCGRIQEISRFSLTELRIVTDNGTTLYVEDEPHLLPDLLRKQIQCIEYAEAEAELAERTIS